MATVVLLATWTAFTTVEALQRYSCRTVLKSSMLLT